MTEPEERIPTHTELEARLAEEGILSHLLDPALLEDDADIADAIASRRNGRRQGEGEHP